MKILLLLLIIQGTLHAEQSFRLRDCRAIDGDSLAATVEIAYVTTTLLVTNEKIRLFGVDCWEWNSMHDTSDAAEHLRVALDRFSLKALGVSA